MIDGTAVREVSDGTVSYRNAHLAGAESEKIVPAGHTLLPNEPAVTKIKRVLEEHIATFDARCGLPE